MTITTNENLTKARALFIEGKDSPATAVALAKLTVGVSLKDRQILVDYIQEHTSRRKWKPVLLSISDYGFLQSFEEIGFPNVLEPTFTIKGPLDTRWVYVEKGVRKEIAVSMNDPPYMKEAAIDAFLIMHEPLSLYQVLKANMFMDAKHIKNGTSWSADWSAWLLSEEMPLDTRTDTLADQANLNDARVTWISKKGWLLKITPWQAAFVLYYMFLGLQAKVTLPHVDHLIRAYGDPYNDSEPYLKYPASPDLDTGGEFTDRQRFVINCGSCPSRYYHNPRHLDNLEGFMCSQDKRTNNGEFLSVITAYLPSWAHITAGVVPIIQLGEEKQHVYKHVASTTY